MYDKTPTESIDTGPRKSVCGIPMIVYIIII